VFGKPKVQSEKFVHLTLHTVVQLVSQTETAVVRSLQKRGLICMVDKHLVCVRENCHSEHVVCMWRATFPGHVKIKNRVFLSW